MKEYINKLLGKKFYIFGLGPSLKNIQEVESDAVKIGVNDICRHFTPDYVVCIDKMRAFAPDRFKYIHECKVPVFTQYNKEHLPLLHQRVDIKLSNKRGIIDLDAEDLSISFCSPFVAAQIAYKMGASEIVFVGVDMNNHHLSSKMHELRVHFNHLKYALENRGIKVTSASDEEGALNSYERF